MRFQTSMKNRAIIEKRPEGVKFGPLYVQGDPSIFRQGGRKSLAEGYRFEACFLGTVCVLRGRADGLNIFNCSVSSRNRALRTAM